MKDNNYKLAKQILKYESKDSIIHRLKCQLDIIDEFDDVIEKMSRKIVILNQVIRQLEKYDPMYDPYNEYNKYEL